MTRDQLLPLIGKRVDVVHGGGMDAGLVILDVGEIHLFGLRPLSPDPVIPLATIRRVAWVESERREMIA